MNMVKCIVDKEKKRFAIWLFLKIHNCFYKKNTITRNVAAANRCLSIKRVMCNNIEIYLFS